MVDFSTLSQTLVDGSVVVLTALVGLVVAYVKQYITKKIQNEEFRSSLLVTTKVLESSVNSSINGLPISSKKALADGKINPEELKQIEDVAYKHFLRQVSPELQKRLQAHITDIQSFMVNGIKSQMEKANTVTGIQ